MRLILVTVLFAAWSPASAADSCKTSPEPALQVLGSGGPIADDGRASSSYLIWVDGQSRILIDAGGGSFLRFGEAGADFAELDFVGLSHFHTDHVADFVTLLKTGYFTARKRPLTVAGPSGNRRFPGLLAFLNSTLDPQDGAYGYLGGYLDGSGGLARLLPAEVAISSERPVEVFRSDDDRVSVDALPVPHGVVPAIAFRVTADDRVFVFTSDQNGSSEILAEFAHGADVLVAHLPIPESAGNSAKRLHASPSSIAALANEAEPGVLVLSHFMQRSLRDPATGAGLVRQEFDGRIIDATDLTCVPRVDD